MNNKINNFDFLRLIFASFVIITHSYPLSGIKECDLMCQISNGQISFSYIGVRGFFVISGYLITSRYMVSSGAQLDFLADANGTKVVVATMGWEKGVVRFSGRADESARTFFRAIGELVAEECKNNRRK